MWQCVKVRRHPRWCCEGQFVLGMLVAAALSGAGWQRALADEPASQPTPAATAKASPAGATSQPGPAARPAAGSQPAQKMTEDEIRKLILDEIRKRGIEPPAEDGSTSQPARRAPTTRPRVRQPASGPTSAPTSGPAGDDHATGCGAKPGQMDLTPPPEDAPQPKLVIQESKLSNSDVWGGEVAHFTFVLKNEGQGPLNVLLSGG